MIIKINGVELTHVTVNEVTFNYDSVSDTFSFTVPFMGEKLFRPLYYNTVEIYDNSAKRKLLTGVILNHNFKSNPNAAEVSISGYSVTGVLDDCPNIQEALASVVQNISDSETTEPVDPDPDHKTGESTQYSDSSLLELAKKLVAPFGIKVICDAIVEDKMNEVYESVTTQPDETIAAYLSKLSTLKNVVMRSTSSGQLLFTQVDINSKSQVVFSTFDSLVTEIGLQVNGQGMHSKIYISGRANIYENTSEDESKTGVGGYIVNNLIKSNRPTLKVQGTEITRIKDVSKAALAEELKNITVTVECRGWSIVDDGILLPGDLVTVLAPECFLYKPTKMLVRSIKLNEDPKGKKSTVTCCLPETMTGESPQNIFG